MSQRSPVADPPSTLVEGQRLEPAGLPRALRGDAARYSGRVDQWGGSHVPSPVGPSAGRAQVHDDCVAQRYIRKTRQALRLSTDTSTALGIKERASTSSDVLRLVVPANVETGAGRLHGSSSGVPELLVEVSHTSRYTDLEQESYEE